MGRSKPISIRKLKLADSTDTSSFDKFDVVEVEPGSLLQTDLHDTCVLQFGMILRGLELTYDEHDHKAAASVIDATEPGEAVLHRQSRYLHWNPPTNKGRKQILSTNPPKKILQMSPADSVNCTQQMRSTLKPKPSTLKPKP